MKIAEMLQEAQYSRVRIGKRWLTAGFPGWVVLEKVEGQISGKEIIRTASEDAAVKELLKGDDAYWGLIK